MDADLRVDDLAALTALGLPVLETVGGDLSISRTPSLTTIAGLGALVNVGGSLVLDDVGTTTITGFGSLTAVDGEVGLLDTPVADLSALTGIDIGGLNLQRNPALHAVGVLAGVIEVSGHVDIQDNAVLSSLDAEALEVVGGDLRVLLNRSLCQSEVDAVAEQVTVAGGVFAFGNDEGC